MHELDRQYKTGSPWEGLPAGNLDLVIIADNGTAPEEEPVVDTSVLPAPDERGGDAPEVAAGDDSKKPPVDPPKVYQGTPEEGPEDGDAIAATGALGELASAQQVTEFVKPADSGELPVHLERIPRQGYDIIVNRSHGDQDLVDNALGMFEASLPWTELSFRGDLVSRKYFSDDTAHPSLMAKFTDYAQEDADRTPQESITELAQASQLSVIVKSDQAQQIVQEEGFSGISLVEPLLVVSKHETKEQLVVYPWQSGEAHSGEEGLHGAIGGAVPDSELEHVNTVVDRLNGLFAVNGIDSKDLGSEQILVGSDGSLHLIDTEMYQKFTPPDPVLAPNELRSATTGGWSVATAASEEVAVGQGELVVGRGSDASLQLTGSTDDSGCIVTVWNPFTQEGGMVNVQDRDEAVQQMGELGSTIPSLMHPGTITHIIGRALIEPKEGHRYMADAGLAFSVKSSQRSGVPIERPTTVRLDTRTGRVEVTDDQGVETFAYTPPTPLATQD